MTPAEAERIRRETIARQQPTAAQLQAAERDVQYRNEQAEIQKQRRMPTVQEQIRSRITSPLIAIRERNIQRMNAPQQPTRQKQPTNRTMYTTVGRQKTMSRGQFKEPRVTMKNIDPFNGFGKRRKKGRNPFW